jgi:hypothetical protein
MVDINVPEQVAALRERLAGEALHLLFVNAGISNGVGETVPLSSILPRSPGTPGLPHGWAAVPATPPMDTSRPTLRPWPVASRGSTLWCRAGSWQIVP